MRSTGGLCEVHHSYRAPGVSEQLPIAVLVSGAGTNLQALFDTIHGREVEIVAVASSAADFSVSLDMLVADPGIARVATRRVALADVPQVFEELITPSSGGKVVVDPRL